MNYLVYSKAGVAVTLATSNKAAHEEIKSKLHLRGMRSASQPEGMVVDYEIDDGKWSIHDVQRDIKRSNLLLGDLMYHLTDSVVFHIADKAHVAHCLHAGAVAWQGKAMIIPASSGSGKSSFTAWLVANGFEYITDELVLINADGELSGIERPIQIKWHGVDAITPLLNRPENVIGGKSISAVTVDSLGGVCCSQEVSRLAMILFPGFKQERAFELKRESSAQAGLQMMANNVNARNHEGHGFREMATLVRSVPAYTLYYGGFDQLDNGFAERLKTMLAQS